MTESSIRLTPPHPSAYETSPGEQAVLRGMDLKNIGGMYGLLLGQRTDANSRAADYGAQLQYSNGMQAELARDQLAEAGRQHDGTIATALAKEGLGLPEALQIARTRGLPVQQDPATTARNVLSAEELRRRSTRANTIDKLGSGLYHMRQAGVNTNPGQALANPDDAVNLDLTTGNALAIDLEGMQQSGANRRAAMKAADGEDGTEFKIKIDPLSQMPVLEQKKGSLPQQAYYASKFNEWVRTGGFRTGSAFNPAPYAGASAAVPAPSTSTALPVEAKSVLARTAGGNMDTARGATPPATQQGTPAPRSATPPPTNGTAPPSIVEKARGVPGAMGVRWREGNWYAVLPGGKSVKVD